MERGKADWKWERVEEKERWEGEWVEGERGRRKGICGMGESREGKKKGEGERGEEGRGERGRQRGKGERGKWRAG